MRKVVGISVVLLMCLVLSSCSGNRSEKAFMGTWKGTNSGEPVELSFIEKGIFIVKLPEETKSSTWTIDSEDNAVLTHEDDMVIATLLNDGKIVARKEGGSSAVVFERSDSNC